MKLVLKSSYLVLLVVLLCFDFFQFSYLHFISLYILILFLAVTPKALLNFAVWRYLSSTKYIWILSALSFAVSFYTATKHYGQGVFDNIIALIFIVLGLSSVVLYYLLVRFSITTEQIKKIVIVSIVLGCTWFLLAFTFPDFFLFKFVPKETVATENVNPTAVRSLFYIGYFYCIFNFLQYGSKKYLYYALLLLVVPFILIKVQRQVLIFTVLTTFISVRIFYKDNVHFKNLSKTFIVFLIVFIPLLFVSSNIRKSLDGFISKFTVMGNIVKLEETDDDVSTSARVGQIIYAVSKISESPILGVGAVKAGNKNSAMGKVYFHVGDIGVLGVYYNFGIFGILLIGSFVYYVVKLKKILVTLRNDTDFVLLVSLWSYLLYLIFSSIGSGESIFSIKMTLAVFALLYYTLECNKAKTIAVDVTN